MGAWARGRVGAWLCVAALLVTRHHALHAQQRMYVTNQDDATVTIIDPMKRTVVETLDLQKMGFGANAKPHHAQVEPDGKHWYLTLIGAGKVLKLDQSNRIVGTVDLEVPGLMALDSKRDLLVVARSMSAVNPPRRIAIIRPSDMKLLDEVDIFFPRPHPIAIDPRGNVAYVASLGVNQMASVSLKDGEVKLLDVDGPYHTLTQFTISPDGNWLVVTASTSNSLLVYDITTEGAPKLAQTVAVEKGPFESAFTADGKKLFVTNLEANRVSVVDVATWKVVKVIADSQFQQPHGAMLSTDGQRIWVSNRHQSGGAHDHEGMKATGGGTAMAICVATATIDTVLPAGHYAAGIGIAPATKQVPAPRACK